MLYIRQGKDSKRSKTNKALALMGLNLKLGRWIINKQTNKNLMVYQMTWEKSKVGVRAGISILSQVLRALSQGVQGYPANKRARNGA